MKKENLYAVVGILFVISGALGLIYQIVWFKYLSLFLGNTTYAQTIVLATFMGGLAIGAFWWGRSADKSKQRLSLYAWLELGIGVYCLLYPSFLSFLKDSFVYVVQSLSLPSDSAVVLVLKLIVSLVSLLLPTILMGGTLPILVRFISERVEESGKNTAILYFLNSLGAVGGSLLAGFFFIRLLGLSTTIYVAATANILIGFAAWTLGRRSVHEASTRSEVQHNEGAHFSQHQAFLAFLTAGVSGLAAMMYEVAWVRLLIPVLGSSTYSFSLMLVSFISGITIGSIIVWSVIERVKDLFRLLAYCQLGVVLSLLVTLPLYARVPFYFWHAAFLFNRSETTYPIFLALEFVFAFLVMVVPTIFLGMTLPIASRINTKSFEVLGKSIGNIFSFNTVGTVVGSLLAGLILIPIIGVKHTIEVGIAFNLTMGILILLSNEKISTRWKTVTLSFVGLSLVPYLVFAGAWSKGLSLSGVFRLISGNVAPARTYEEFQSGNEATRVLYYKEGTTATVAVIEGEFQKNPQNVMLINGKADASSVGDLPTQMLLAHVPMLTHPNPRTALVIGFGSGVTVGSSLAYPLKNVDCVEISPEVIEASQYFNDVNRRPLEDPRLRVYIDDALAFLKVTQKTYDVIISEPSNPWIAGIGNLFTLEFFEECKRRLNPNGLMVQWFHLYEMDDPLLKLVLRTYRAAFPIVTMWQIQTSDILIIGSKANTELDFGLIDERMKQQKVMEDLNRIQIPNLATLLSLQILSPNSVRDYAGVADLNTEDMPRLEYSAPQAFFVNQGVKELSRLDERMSVGNTDLFLAQRIQQKVLSDEELRSIGILHTRPIRGNLTFGYTILSDYNLRHPNDLAVLQHLADASDLLRRPEDGLAFRKQIAGMLPNDANALESYGWQKYIYERTRGTVIGGFETQEFEKLFRRSIELTRDTVDRFRVRLADMFFGTQQYQKAVDNYRRALQIRETYTADTHIRQDILLLQLARGLYELGHTDRALGFALQATAYNPKNEAAKDFIYTIWMNGSSRGDSLKKKL